MSVAAFRPVISFSPNWTPIFTGESVTLSCNVAPTAQGNLGYSWYRDGQRIPGDQQSLVIQPAKVTDSGDYQCQAGASERSDSIRLDVNSNWLILQAPPAVYEGDSLSLRCHSWSGYDTRKPVFYKDNKAIGSPVSGSELQIGRVGVTASGTYRCEKKKSSSDGKYILVSALFSYPLIKVSPYSLIEGDHMTITCDTELSPRRETTELQFAFYRNGHIVQGFSLSNQYGVPSAQLEDSGNYTCEVQTPTGSVRKRSREAHIHIQEIVSYPQIKVSSDQVTEGDHMTITCDTELSSHRETTELQFAFYRNGHNVQGFSLSNQYGVPSAQLEDSGNYTCEVQTPTGSVRKKSREAHIHIQELFPYPQIQVSLHQVTEGDNMTITCDTELHPHRETTELQFAFYRNGYNVQGFSLSNQYGVPSAQLEDSGNYTCEVQTPTGSVRKRSNMAHIHIQGGNPSSLVAALTGILAVLLFVITVIITFKFRHKLAPLLMCPPHHPKTERSFPKTHFRTVNDEETHNPATLYEDISDLVKEM
ncbi:Fc receptor-like protein 3 [Xenopus tropicalis]|uniref:Fc receptor-like protein 3 n=1 Tax=Xenopus tropicalis TaxID=8364 RepID=A0A8J1ISG6_XENTR|nr:Fc receptor-like protein 3 [Xenopus tropicalis]